MYQKKLRDITVLGLLIAFYVFVMIKFGPTLWSVLALTVTALAAIYAIFIRDKKNNDKAADSDGMKEYMYNASDETSNKAGGTIEGEESNKEDSATVDNEPDNNDTDNMKEENNTDTEEEEKSSSSDEEQDSKSDDQ